MPYSPLLIKPFRDEVVTVGVKELLTTEDVDNFFQTRRAHLFCLLIQCAVAQLAWRGRRFAS